MDQLIYIYIYENDVHMAILMCYMVPKIENQIRWKWPLLRMANAHIHSKNSY